MSDGAQASPLAVEVGALLVKGAAEGQFSVEDVRYMAAALQRAGVEVLLPPRPRDTGTAGWLKVEYRRCGDPTCHCSKPDAPRHGPYVIHAWREGGRIRKKSLGPLGKTHAPAVPARLQQQLDQLNKLDMRFLHDD